MFSSAQYNETDPQTMSEVDDMALSSTGIGNATGNSKIFSLLKIKLK